MTRGEGGTAPRPPAKNRACLRFNLRWGSRPLPRLCITPGRRGAHTAPTYPVGIKTQTRGVFAQPARPGCCPKGVLQACRPNACFVLFPAHRPQRHLKPSLARPGSSSPCFLPCPGCLAHRFHKKRPTLPKSGTSAVARYSSLTCRFRKTTPRRTGPRSSRA